MTDPVVHAKMTTIIGQEKKLQEERTKINSELPVWSRRVDLARSKGMNELAKEASDRLEELKARVARIGVELDTFQMEKDMLRYESRRPSGREVERAENMLEQVRLGGLVDPDRMDKELDPSVAFDFDEDK